MYDRGRIDAAVEAGGEVVVGGEGVGDFEVRIVVGGEFVADFEVGVEVIIKRTANGRR